MILRHITVLALAVAFALGFLTPAAWGQGDPDSHDIEDTIPPTSNIPATNTDGTDNGPTGSAVTATNISISFDSNDPAAQPETFECNLDGGATAWASCSSPFSASGLTSGSHLFQVRATDKHGNQGPIAVRAWTQVDASTPVACTGSNIIDIYPDGDPQHNNFGQIVTNNKADSVKETFCIHDGTHTVTTRAELGQKDEIQGEYSDSSRPQLVGNGTVQYIVFSAAANGLGTFTGGPAVTGVAISGAATDAACSVNSGRGIGGGGSYMTVANVRIANNAGSGIGASGPRLLVQNAILEDNVNDTCFVTNGTTASGANIKTTNSFRIENSMIRESHWDGVWCDLDCDTGGSSMQVIDTSVVDNQRSGVHYEVTSSAPVALIQNDTIQGNGWKNDASGRTVIEGEVLAVSSSFLDVNNNRFGETGAHLGSWGPNFNAAGRVYAVFLKEDDRAPGIDPSSYDVSGNFEQDQGAIYPADQYSCTFQDFQTKNNLTVSCD